MAKILQLNFETANGKKMTLTVDEPKVDITAAEVELAMTAIISTGTFVIEDLPLSKALSARVIDRTVTNLIG